MATTKQMARITSRQSRAVELPLPTDTPEKLEYFHFVQAAQLLFRREAAVHDQTLLEYLLAIEILTVQDMRHQSHLDLYEGCGLEDAAELARIMEKSPYARTLIKTYRPQLYQRTQRGQVS